MMYGNNFKRLCLMQHQTTDREVLGSIHTTGTVLCPSWHHSIVLVNTQEERKERKKEVTYRKKSTYDLMLILNANIMVQICTIR